MNVIGTNPDDLEEMFQFLKETLENIEEDQSDLINVIEEKYRDIITLSKEKEELKEKMADHIGFFNPVSAKERDRIPRIENQISDIYQEIDGKKENLKKMNHRLLQVTRIIEYIKDTEERAQEEEVEGLNEEALDLLELNEIERTKIARDLQNIKIQNLTNLVSKMEIYSKTGENNLESLKLELLSMIGTLRYTINDIQNIIFYLEPASLEEFNLQAALENYSNRMKGIHPEVYIDLNIENNDVFINNIIGLTLFRIIMEACNNVFQYGNATLILISILCSEKGIQLSIEDDGNGFDIEEEKSNQQDKKFGISLMKERVQLLLGNFEIYSQKENGTSIKIEIPL